MRTYKLIILIQALLLTHLLSGQNNKLSMEDAVIGQWDKFYPESIYGYWQPGSHILTYNKDQKMIALNAKTQAKDTLCTLDVLNTALNKAGEDSLKRFPSIKWINEKRIYFRHKLKSYVYSVAKEKLVDVFELQKKDQKIDFLPNLKNKMLAVTNENSLYIVKTNSRIAVAESDNDETVYGQAVSRREFGISKGTFWSPEGNYLAFYKKDNSEVKQYPLIDIRPREAETKMIRYPMAGMDSEHVCLGVFNIKTQKTVYIENKHPESEKYLTNISWGPEEKYIYIQVLNRAQNHMKLNQYNAETGKLVQTLFEVKNEKYVEPYHKLKFLPEKNNQFIYQTRADGYNHLYLYNTSGKLIRQITSGQWEVTSFHGFDDNGYIYYTSTEKSPVERHAYKISVKSPKNKMQLTKVAGTHRVKISNDGNYIFDRYSSTTIPGVVQIINTKTKEKQTLLEAENPLKDYNLGEMNIGTLKAADGKTDLYYRMIKPSNFNASKEYPAIVYTYGGPHAQLVKNRWLGGARLWQQYMAQQGYVVLTVDNRGSANRGLEFENIIHRQCGKNEMADQLKGLQMLKKTGFVDTTRIGVHGWSYGGFMTTSLITHHPDKFKVGVAGGPVIDWKYYEIMYGERYMDTPQENPDGYKSTSLIPMAPKLKRKLLIIHGGIDPTVVQQHSLVFIRECIKHNVPVDYFVYPRAAHNVRGKDRIHLMQKVTDYFEDYL